MLASIIGHSQEPSASLGTSLQFCYPEAPWSPLSGRTSPQRSHMSCPSHTLRVMSRPAELGRNPLPLRKHLAVHLQKYIENGDHT